MPSENSRVSDECPACGSTGRVVTAVTVAALGQEPRRVIVTRQCSAGTCHLKYPSVKSEEHLTDEERAAWRPR